MTATRMSLQQALAHAVTRYDRQQEGKRGYNVYALPQYLARCEDIADDVNLRGMSLADSLNLNMLDRLRDSVARYLIKEGFLPAIPVWTNR